MSQDDGATRGQTSPRDLTGPELEQLRDALVDAFNPSGLEELARFELDKKLSEIAAPGNTEYVAFQLIEWADSNGRLDDLIAGALCQNQGNRKLRAFKQEIWGSRSPKKPCRARRRSISQQMSMLWKVIAGFMIAVLVIAAFNVLGVIRGNDPTPPPEVGASMSNVRVTNPNVSLRDFLVDHFELSGVTAEDHDQLRAALRELPNLQDPSTLTDGMLTTMGFELTFDVTLDGLAGRTCQLKWSLYDAASRRQLPEGYLNDQLAFPYGSLVPGAQHDRFAPSIWIARPPRAGPFFVRLALYDDRPAQSRVQLAQAESEPFA